MYFIIFIWIFLILFIKNRQIHILYLFLHRVICLFFHLLFFVFLSNRVFFYYNNKRFLFMLTAFFIIAAVFQYMP